MAKHIMKGYLMYNDNYYPSMAEDDITSAAAYSEYDSEPYTPDEWLNSQETTPILPLPEDGSDWSDQENDFDMQDRAASPMQAMPRRPMPDRPVAPLPDRPGRPDRPVPPMPDRPGRPNRPVPPRPTPPRPVPPVRPDWSWNWGTILPGIVLPLSRPRQILQCCGPRTDSDLREQPPGGVQSKLFELLPHIQCYSRALPHYGLSGQRHALASGGYLDELPAESGLHSCPGWLRLQFPASDILFLTMD